MAEVRQKRAYKKKVPMLDSEKYKNKAALQPWKDIFVQSKIVVSMNPRNYNNTEIIMRHIQDECLQTFDYSAAEMVGMPFNLLFGKATIRAASHKLQNAMLTGKAACLDNNYYRRGGVVLSCHIMIQSITNRIPPAGPSDTIQLPVKTNPEKWAVITFRSASVVGNSRYSGVGLLGVERIPQVILESTVKPCKPKMGKDGVMRGGSESGSQLQQGGDQGGAFGSGNGGQSSSSGGGQDGSFMEEIYDGFHMGIDDMMETPLIPNYASSQHSGSYLDEF